MAIKSKRKKIREVPVPTNCPFCKGDYNPDYKKYQELANYLTTRAKILGRGKTGICSKHQRVLSREIKRARHLGLLPYSPTL